MAKKKIELMVGYSTAQCSKDFMENTLKNNLEYFAGLIRKDSVAGVTKKIQETPKIGALYKISLVLEKIDSSK